MNRLQNFFSRFRSECLVRDIPFEIICEGDNLLGILVLKQYKPRSQHIKTQLAESARDNHVHVATRGVDQGVVFIFGNKVISENDISTICYETSKKYNDFFGRLEQALLNPLGEAQIKGPTNALERAAATEPFPDRFTARKLSNRKKKTIDDKIEEALDGMATPDDVQPQDALKALFGAMKDSGLAGDLKKAGVSWHIAEPGKHMVTFNRGDVPIMQKSTIELADTKVLGEVLSALRSIADGKAPEAGQIELDMMQQRAKDAREKQKQLTDIATQYTAQVDPEQQAATTPTLAASRQRSGTALKEAQNKCEHCGHTFHTPDWLDTTIHCPKCSRLIDDDPTQKTVHPANREWGTGEKNHYFGRGNW